jgi:hypothetical protein
MLAGDKFVFRRNIMKSIVAAILAFSTLSAPAFAAEPAAAEAAKPAYSTAETPVGDILDSAELKAIVEKHMPGFSSHPSIEMARGFTLKAIQSFQPDQITDELLAKIDADFAALAAKS